MKKLIFIITLFTSIVQADDRNHVLSLVTKYGPNGYETYKQAIQNRVQPVFGLNFQEAVSNSPLVLGFGVYMDSTLESSIGIRF